MNLTRSLAIFLLAAIASPALAQWSQVRSQNITVVSNAGQGRDVVARFEQMRAVFGALLRRPKLNQPVATTVIAFRSATELQSHAPVVNGRPAATAAFSLIGEDRNYIALVPSSEESWQAALHEYAHILLNGNYPRTQPWFDEGMAEYLAGTRIGKDVELGAAPLSAAVLSENRPWIPVLDLLSAPTGSQMFDDSGDRRSMAYAESWLFISWLLANQKLSDAARYFDLVVVRKTPIAQAANEAFGMSPQELDRGLAGYAKSARNSVQHINLPAGVDPNVLQVQRLNDPQARAVLADLHIHMPERRDQGIAELAKVSDAEPNNQFAQRQLGIAYIWKHELDDAHAHLQRAAELDAHDARLHYYTAVFLNLGAQDKIENASRAQQMIFELQKAIDIDPQYADAFHLSALAQLAAGRNDEALAKIRDAVALSPREDRYRLTFANVLLANGQLDSATNLLVMLQTSPDRAVAEEAKAVMSNAAAMAAKRQRWEEQGLTSYHDPTDPRWKPKAGQKLDEDAKPAAEAPPDKRKVEYLKGTLVSVSCADRAATVTVASGGRTWTLKTPDYKKLVLIGADDFNCNWKNVKASVNYKSNGAAAGDLVSLEVD